MKPASSNGGCSSGLDEIPKTEIENAVEIERSSEHKDLCYEGPLLYEDVLEDTNCLDVFLSKSLPLSEVKNDVRSTDETTPDENTDPIGSHKIYSSHKWYVTPEKLNSLNAERQVEQSAKTDNENISQKVNPDLSVENVNSISGFDPFQMKAYQVSNFYDDDTTVPSENKTVSIELSVASSVPVDANKCKGSKKKGHKPYGRNIFTSPIIQNHTTDKKSYSKKLTSSSSKSKRMYDKLERNSYTPATPELRVSLIDVLQSENHLEDEVNVYANILTASPDANGYKINKNYIDSKTKAKQHDTIKAAPRKSPRKKLSSKIEFASFLVENELERTPKEIKNVKKCRGKRTPKQPVFESIAGPSKSFKKNTARKSFPQKTGKFSEKLFGLDKVMSADEDDNDLLEKVTLNKSRVQKSGSNQRFVSEKENSFLGVKNKEKNNISLSDFLSKSSASESCPTPRSNFMQLISKVSHKNSSEAPFQSDFITQIFQQANNYQLKFPRKQTNEDITPALENVDSANNNAKKKIKQTQLPNGNNIDQVKMETEVHKRGRSKSKSTERDSIKKDPQSVSRVPNSRGKSRKRKRSTKNSQESRVQSDSEVINDSLKVENCLYASSSDEVEPDEFVQKSKKYCKKGVKNSKIKVSSSSISLFEDHNSPETNTSKQNHNSKRKIRRISVPPLELLGNKDTFLEEEQSDEISSLNKKDLFDIMSTNATLDLKNQSSSVEPNYNNNISEMELATPSMQIENMELLLRKKQKVKRKPDDESFDEAFTVEDTIGSNNELNVNSVEQESTSTPFKTEEENMLAQGRIIYRLNPNCKVHYDPKNNSHFISVPLDLPALQEGMVLHEFPLASSQLPVSYLRNISSFTPSYLPQVIPSIVSPQIVQPILTSRGVQSFTNIQPSSTPTSLVLPMPPSSSSSILPSVKLANADFTFSPAQASSSHHKLNEPTMQNGVILNNTGVTPNSVTPVFAPCSSEVLTNNKRYYTETSRQYYQAGPGETRDFVNSKLQEINIVCNFNWEFIVRRRTEVDVPHMLELSRSIFGVNYCSLTVKNFCTQGNILAGLADLLRKHITESNFPTRVQYSFHSSFEDELMIKVLHKFVSFYLASIYSKIEGKRGKKLKDIFFSELYENFPLSMCSLLSVMLSQNVKRLTVDDIGSLLTAVGIVMIFHEYWEHVNKMPITQS